MFSLSCVWHTESLVFQYHIEMFTSKLYSIVLAVATCLQVELFFDGRQEETREFRFHTSSSTAATLTQGEAAKQLVPTPDCQ